MKWIKLFLAAVIFLFSAGTTFADMEMLTEEKLSSIAAQSGLTVVMDTTLLISADTIAISDTDSDPVNWIRFNGFSVDDGTGLGFKISNIDTEPFFMDVGTTDDNRTILQLNLTPFANPISFHVQELEFCGQAIGRFDLNAVELSSESILRFSHHMDGSAGIEFDAGIALDMASVEYAYNSFDEMLSISGVHLVGEADGMPEDPSTWEMSGLMSVGDLMTAPAAIDVNTDSMGQTSLVVAIPISGSIRIEDVSMGGTSFGPMVIDNIMAHRLSVSFSP